jgi:hypothetical protein
MKFTHLLLIFCLAVLQSVYSNAQSLQRELYYKVLASNDTVVINKQLNLLAKSPTLKAFEGALLMKKSSFFKSPNQKLKCFKKGHKMLETEIQAHANNVEYRFLRFMIQEHAPQLLNYNRNIQEDKKAILSNYKSLTAELKKAIEDYVRASSTHLTLNELVK